MVLGGKTYETDVASQLVLGYRARDAYVNTGYLETQIRVLDPCGMVKFRTPLDMG